MNKLFATIATLVFTGSVHAASDSQVYHGWASGNPDLSSDVDAVALTSRVPSGPPGSDIYNGFERGNAELSYGSETLAARLGGQPGIGDGSAGMGRGSVSSIYRGFEIGNPDL